MFFGMLKRWMTKKKPMFRKGDIVIFSGLVGGVRKGLHYAVGIGEVTQRTNYSNLGDFYTIKCQKDNYTFAENRLMTSFLCPVCSSAIKVDYYKQIPEHIHNNQVCYGSYMPIQCVLNLLAPKSSTRRALRKYWHPDS